MTVPELACLDVGRGRFRLRVKGEGRPPLGLCLACILLCALRVPLAGQHPRAANVLEGAVLFADGPRIDRAGLRFSPPAATPEASAHAGLTLADLERHHIERAIKMEGGHIERAACRLGHSAQLALRQVEALRPAVQILEGPSRSRTAAAPLAQSSLIFGQIISYPHRAARHVVSKTRVTFR